MAEHGAQGPRKRSVTIAGHRTSLSLEDEFWHGLQQLADSRNLPLAKLIGIIDEQRGHTNLSSALRLAVLQAVKQGEIYTEH